VTAPATTLRSRPSLPRSRRLVGVDAARGLALLGMMAAHLLERTTAAGDPSAAFALVNGRSSATFAVLAGVGLALADGGHAGGRTPYARMVARTSVRALCILLIGLVLTEAGPPVAVILQYYALSFLLLAPLLRLPAAVLGVGGLAWLGLAPVVSHVVRESTGLLGPGSQVGITRLLVDPSGSVTDLFLTGYYPVLTWFGYLLVGAAVGRLALGRRGVALAVAGAGLLLAAGAAVVSSLLLGTAGARDVLTGVDPVFGRGTDGPWFGTAPTSSPWWLAIDTPHSGTAPDLIGTTGAALLALGACLLLAGTVAGWALVPLAAAGSMTLSLYTVHVLAVLSDRPGLDPGQDWTVHAALALVFATLWTLRFRRGPLEVGVAGVVDALAGPSTPATAPDGTTGPARAEAPDATGSTGRSVKGGRGGPGSGTDVHGA